MVVQVRHLHVARQQHLRGRDSPGTLQSSDVVSPVISSLSAASGGTLASGTYYYVIGAVTATGTLTSLESSVTVGRQQQGDYQLDCAGGHLGRDRLPDLPRHHARWRNTDRHGFRRDDQLHRHRSSGQQQSCPCSWARWPTMAGPCRPLPRPPTAASSPATRRTPTFAPLLDERGYLRNPLFPGIGAVESASSTPNTVSLSPASLVGIDQGLSYSQSITASGGTGTGYLIGITAGALPPGFTLTLDGTLAGTATTLGSFTFTVTGFDSAGNFGSRNYTLDVNPAPSITTSSLPMAPRTPPTARRF